MSKQKSSPRISLERALSLMEQETDPLKPSPTCAHCGGIHARACPRVKRMVFKGEEVTEVEFWKDWPQDGILWMEDVATVVIEAEERDKQKAEDAERKTRLDGTRVRARSKARKRNSSRVQRKRRSKR